MANDHREQRAPRAREEYDVDWRDDPANTMDIERSRTPKWLVIIPLLLLALTGLFLWDAARSDDAAVDSEASDAPAIQSEVDGGDEADGDEASATATDDGEEGDAGESSDDAADESEDAVDTAAGALPAPPTGAAYVDATLEMPNFKLSGVVPSEELKAQLEGQAEVAYAPFFSSELEVDESVDGAEWLAATPNVVGLIPMISDGTIRIQDGEVTLVGRSPTAFWSDLFEQTVGDFTGLPVNAEGIEVTGLEPPLFVNTVENGKVTLSGNVPSEELVQMFVDGAAAVYGEENVTNEFTVDPNTYTSFWMFSVPINFQVLQPFSSYEIRVENGLSSGRLQGGVEFESDSAELAPVIQQVLGVGVAIMARDASIFMTVTGHTDDEGPDDYNQELSVRRAASVVAFFEAAGIDSARLAATGEGESEPLAPNDTEEGRARNRRVEFTFGPPSQ